MINVIASVHVKPGKKAEYLKTFKPNLPLVTQEKGCIEYFPTADVPTGLPPQTLNENVITIIEKWEDLDALLAHLKAPHYLAYKEAVKDLVQEVSILILQEV